MEIYILDSGVLASHKEFQVEGKGTRVEDGRVFRHADGPVRYINLLRLMSI